MSWVLDLFVVDFRNNFQSIKKYFLSHSWVFTPRQKLSIKTSINPGVKVFVCFGKIHSLRKIEGSIQQWLMIDSLTFLIKVILDKMKPLQKIWRPSSFCVIKSHFFQPHIKGTQYYVFALITTLIFFVTFHGYEQ